MRHVTAFHSFDTDTDTDIRFVRVYTLWICKSHASICVLKCSVRNEVECGRHDDIRLPYKYLNIDDYNNNNNTIHWPVKPTKQMHKQQTRSQTQSQHCV